VSLDIAATYTKLQKLAVLARQKSIFEDKPKDINDLIQEIKVDISRLQRELSTLQVSITPNPSPEARQHNEHSKIVINSLQSKIVDYSNSFKSVLQTRYENMQQQKSRREEYSMITPSSSKATAISDSPLYHPEKRTNKDTSVIDFGQSFEQQQLLLPNQANMEYIDSRSQAIESIESTIQELGQIFQNFNVLLQGQREMVQRIDDNVMDVSHNTEAAHTQLIKFYQGMSGNQALMVKVFGLIMAFFVLFVMMT
jgi:syntaxin 5